MQVQPGLSVAAWSGGVSPPASSQDAAAPLDEQALLARLSIRPFMQVRDLGKKGAGILRAKPTIKWDKDRGTEPHGDKSNYPWLWHAEEPPLDCPGGLDFTGNRWNNVHLTLDRQRAARG